MSEALHQAILAVPEEGWQSYGEAHAKEIRECAEVSFVPGEKSETQRHPAVTLCGDSDSAAAGRVV